MSVLKTMMITAALTALIAAPAGADEITQLLDGLSHKPAVQSAVKAPLLEAREAGLPTKYLLAKAREGVAKRVPAGLLGSVLAKLVTHLDTSRGNIPGKLKPQPALIEAGARALLSGVDAAAIRHVLDRVARDPKPAASPVKTVALLTDIHELGVPATQARSLVVALLDNQPQDIARGSVLSLLRMTKRVTRRPWRDIATRVTQQLPRFQTLGQVGMALTGAGVGDSATGPGKSNPGHAGSPPAGLAGKGVSGAPGQTGSAPGQSGATPANGAEPPGQAGGTPGQSGNNPGQSGNNPGQDKGGGRCPRHK